jgi:3-phosphoshikimate 1-carboxyvinyltransferase
LSGRPTGELATGEGGPRRRIVPPGGSLGGSVEVPGDKSISHRALILGALAEGTSVLGGLSGGDDVRATAEAIQMLGAALAVREDRGPLGWSAEVSGGRSRLAEPEDVIDCRNSGTAIRLLAGLAAALEGAHVVLSGDASLRRRPMDRVTEPLRRMGAHIDKN